MLLLDVLPVVESADDVTSDGSGPTRIFILVFTAEEEEMSDENRKK